MVTRVRACSHSILVLLCLLITSGCARPPDEGRFQFFDDIDYVLDSSWTPPPAQRSWQPFSIPHAFRFADAELSNQVYWLRIRLERPSDESMRGLYFYRYTKSIDVWFNGDYLDGDSHSPGWDTAAWNHPRLVPIQNANWRVGSNEIMVRLQTSRLGGVFYGVLYGDIGELQKLKDQRYFRQITINEWLLSFGILVTMLAGLLWSLRRKETLYWQFALVSACWLLVTYHMVAYQTPLSDRWWLPLVHIGIDCWVYSLSLFMANWFQLERSRQLRIQRVLLALAVLWHLAAILPWWWTVAYVFHTAGLGCIFVLLYHGVKKRMADGGRLSVLAVVLCIQVVCVAHDIYTLVVLPTSDTQTAFHWSQMAFPLVQAVFLVALMMRFVGALTVAEGINVILEARVGAARQQLEKVYAEARGAELQNAAAEERGRIYRDLHDDVGSKLLSIVVAARESRVGELASAALESLREAVGRANNPEIAFSDFLGQLREEMSLRLTSLGI